MKPTINTFWPVLLRRMIGGWLLVCLPLGLWLYTQLNHSLLQSKQQQRQLQLQQSTVHIQQLIGAYATEQMIDPSYDGLQQAILQQLPPGVEAVWLRDQHGRTLPWVLPAHTQTATPSYKKAQWVPLSAPHKGWQLGVHFHQEIAPTAPLANGVLAMGLLLWGLLYIAWWRWGRNHLQLKQVSERFQQTLDFAGDALFFIRPKTGQIVQANPQLSRLLGYDNEEIRHLPPTLLFKTSGRRRYFRLVKQVQREGYGEARRLLFRRKDGTTFYGSVHARLGKLGREPMVHGVLRDVTSAQEMEQELRQKNSDLRLLNRVANQLAESQSVQEILDLCLQTLCQSFNMAGGGIYLTRENQSRLQLAAHLHLTTAEEHALKELTPQQSVIGQALTTGQPYGATDLAGHPLLASPLVVQNGWQSLQTIPLSSQAEIVGVLFLFDRKERPFSAEEVQLLLGAGNQIGTAINSADLNAALKWQGRLTQASNRELERSRLQMHNHLSRLEESNRTLERLDRMKNSFLALASHELRTPLTYILPAIELLEQKLQSDGEETAQLLQAIDLGGRRLKHIVGDLLQMARIEVRDIYLAKEAIDLELLLNRLKEQVLPTLEQRQLELHLPPIPEKLPLFGDIDHLQNLLQRLLENAIKFTPDQGEIFFEVRQRGREEVLANKEALLPFSAVFFEGPLPAMMLQLTIRDTGIGIAPEDCLRIFDKFTNAGDIREHFTSTTSFGGKGVGLGLALAKGLIEIQGGMIWVDSDTTNDGSGAVFHLLLPLGGLPDR